MTTARRAVIEEMYDPTIGCVVANESGPARAGNTCYSGPDHCKGVAMDSLPYPFSIDEAFERNQLALSILSHRRDPAAVDQAIAALQGATVAELMDRPSGDA